MNTQISHIGEVQIGMKGFMKFDLLKAVLDADGNQMYDEEGHAMAYEETRREVVPWFANQILDNFRNQAADFSNWAGLGSKAQVGTSSVPLPSSGDTGLYGWTAGTSDIVASTWGAQGTAPWYKFDQRTYRFPSGPGIGNQNLSEAGVGWDVVSGANLTSRALIVNPSGVPVTITPDADEILDMTYQLRYYPPLTDVEGTVALNGVNYDTVLRAANVSASPGDGGIGSAFSKIGGINDWDAYDGALGAINQGPSGTSVNCDNGNQFNLAYQNNSYSIDMQCDCGPSGWILPASAGIRCLIIPTSGFSFQCSFSSNPGGTTIPKDANFTMSFVWRMSWAAMNWAYNWNMQAANDVTTPTTGNWNTNLAQTLLRINWTDADANDQQFKLQVETGTTFRIVEAADPTLWVDYKTTGAYSEGTDWTDYAVTQTAIQGTGPVAGNATLIKSTIFD